MAKSFARVRIDAAVMRASQRDGANTSTNMGKPLIAELDAVFDEVDKLLKKPEAGAELAETGVNASLAMTLVDGLRAYLHGDKGTALLELGTATDEIAARMASWARPGES